MNEELLEQVEDLTNYIKVLAPVVEVVYTGEIFEDEHANLEVYPPLTWTPRQCRELQRQIADRAVDIHLDTGYLILVYVCTPEQQIAEAQLEFIRAQQKIHAAEQVLAEAKALGLLKSSAVESELIPA